MYPSVILVFNNTTSVASGSVGGRRSMVGREEKESYITHSLSLFLSRYHMVSPPFINLSYSIWANHSMSWLVPVSWFSYHVYYYYSVT